jgi:hypothetical protein
VFDKEAGVFDDEKARGAGFCGSCGVSDSLLEPEAFGMDGDSGIGDRGNFFGTAKNFHDIYGNGNVFEARIGFLPKDFRFVGIDRDDLVADGLQVRGDFVGRTKRIGGQAHDGNGFGLAEKIGDRVGRMGAVRRKV